MDLAEALAGLGFELVEERADALIYAAHPNRYMTYWVHVYEDDTALFTWEFAIADYLATKGIQVGSDEALNQYAYPREDDRGPQDAAWLAAAIDRAEAMLAAIRLDRPEG